MKRAGRSSGIERSQFEQDRAGQGALTRASLPDLFNIFCASIPDCRHEEIVDTLKRLATNRYIVLTKWDDEMRKFVEYAPGGTSDSEFFYQGDFRYMLHEQGRPYLDGLKSAFPQSSSVSG